MARKAAWLRNRRRIRTGACAELRRHSAKGGDQPTKFVFTTSLLPVPRGVARRPRSIPTSQLPHSVSYEARAKDEGRLATRWDEDRDQGSTTNHPQDGGRALRDPAAPARRSSLVTV
jgi:hypothetical protein